MRKFESFDIHMAAGFMEESGLPLLQDDDARVYFLSWGYDYFDLGRLERLARPIADRLARLRSRIVPDAEVMLDDGSTGTVARITTSGTREAVMLHNGTVRLLTHIFDVADSVAEVA